MATQSSATLGRKVSPRSAWLVGNLPPQCLSEWKCGINLPFGTKKIGFINMYAKYWPRALTLFHAAWWGVRIPPISSPEYQWYPLPRDDKKRRGPPHLYDRWIPLIPRKCFIQSNRFDGNTEVVVPPLPRTSSPNLAFLHPQCPGPVELKLDQANNYRDLKQTCFCEKERRDRRRRIRVWPHYGNSAICFRL